MIFQGWLLMKTKLCRSLSAIFFQYAEKVENLFEKKFNFQHGGDPEVLSYFFSHT